MIDLSLFGRKTNSIFDLLGKTENDISYAIGLGFSKAPAFLRLCLQHLGIRAQFSPNLINIRLQQYERELGFTDFEIEQEGEFSIIVEAKKGWNYPSANQLDKYSSRPSFTSSPSTQKLLVVFTESSRDFTSAYFNIKKSNSYVVKVVSYKELWTIARQARLRSKNYEKRVLRELINYLETVMTMQNKYSNYVFVVSLGSGTKEGWRISWIDIVKKRRRYFHPIGKRGFPKEPPNYIGFRYHGKLQSIHHIDKYKVITNPHTEFPEIPSQRWDNPHYVYSLGKPIIPSKTVRTGGLFMNGKVWAMLDLLLTSKTVAEARDKTKQRDKLE